MAVYDPNKRYQWMPTDKFEMSGDQFGLILNAFRTTLSSPEAQRILLVQHANEVIENIMARAVENDIIKEMPEEAKKE
jgi:hypothetical protein